MLQVVANMMSVASGASEFSVPMSMSGANCVQATGIGINLNGAASWTIVLQGSLDNTNWTDVVTWASLTSGNNYPTKQTGIGYAFVRCKVSPVTGGPVICTIYLNSSAQ